MIHISKFLVIGLMLTFAGALAAQVSQVDGDHPSVRLAADQAATNRLFVAYPEGSNAKLQSVTADVKPWQFDAVDPRFADPSAPLPQLPVPPGATSSAPIAVGGFLSYNAQPNPGSKHTSGGGFLLYPAAFTDTGHPTYARLSIDVSSATNCKGCLGTSFRFGGEQVLFTAGSFTTAVGADVGVQVQSNATVGAVSFNLREAYHLKSTSKFVTDFFVSVGGEQNGNSGVLSRFEAGFFKRFGGN